MSAMQASRVLLQNVLFYVLVSGFLRLLYIALNYKPKNKQILGETSERKEELICREMKLKALTDQLLKSLTNFENNEERQKFFFREINLGEQLLQQGDVVRGIEHYCKGLMVSKNLERVLRVCRQTFSPQIFNMIMERLEKNHC